LPADASGGGLSLATYTDRLADELGYRLITTVATEAASGEAQRVVLADELRDDEAGADLLGEPWLYVRTGDQFNTQNRVMTAPGIGYQGANSAVMLARPFAAPLEVGDTIVVTSPLPIKRFGLVKGLHDCVNEALALVWIKARLTFTGNGTDSYSLAAYPFVQSYQQTRGIYELQPHDPTLAPVLSPYRYEIVHNGIERTLVTRRPYVYNSAETFYLDIAVRADRLVYDGASWIYVAANGTPGLQNETYLAAAPEEWVVAEGMCKALQFLTRYVMQNRRLSQDEKDALLADILPRRRTWAITALRIKHALYPQPLPERRETLVAGVSGWPVSLA